MTEEETQTLAWFVDPNLNVYATTQAPDNVATDLAAATAYMAGWKWVMNLNSVAPEWRNMISASLIMFRGIAAQQTLLEHIVKHLEEAGADEFASLLIEPASALSLTKRAALEGLEKVFNIENNR